MVENATTNTTVMVCLHAVSKCPVCGKKIELQRRLNEESLVTGNTTQRAAYHAKEMRALAQGEADDRGWTREMCGACRDRTPEARDKQALLKVQIDQLRACGTDEKSEQTWTAEQYRDALQHPVAARGYAHEAIDNAIDPAALADALRRVADAFAPPGPCRVHVGLRQNCHLGTIGCIESHPEACDAPPVRWWCSRGKGHDGPCAARQPTTLPTGGTDR